MNILDKFYKVVADNDRVYYIDMSEVVVFIKESQQVNSESKVMVFMQNGIKLEISIDHEEFVRQIEEG